MALHECSRRASPRCCTDLEERQRRSLCHGRVQTIHFWDGSALVPNDADGCPELRCAGLPSELAG